MPTNSGNDDAEESSQSRLRRAAENLEQSLTNSVLDDDAPNDIDSHGGPTVSEEVNDEKRHKTREIGIYYSLIFAAGTGFAQVLYPLYFLLFWPFFLVAFPAIFFFSVWGFLTGSGRFRVHLLLWYGCLFTLASANLAGSTLRQGFILLFVLPVIWVWNASRT